MHGVPLMAVASLVSAGVPDAARQAAALTSPSPGEAVLLKVRAMAGGVFNALATALGGVRGPAASGRLAENGPRGSIPLGYSPAARWRPRAA